MTCPSAERLAAAATGEDDAILLHVADCAACQLTFDEQREIRSVIARSSPVRLSPTQRESLAAEVMAHADALPAARRSPLPWIGAGLAAAAAAVLVVALGAPGPDRAPAPVHDGSGSNPAPVNDRITAVPIETEDVPTAEQAGTDPPRTPTSPRVAPRARAKLGGDGDYSSDGNDDDVVRLRGGSLTVDALDARPMRVVTGDTAIAVTRGKLRVVATKGVIKQVSVFAGSAEITIDGRRQVIEAGMVWERDQATQDAEQARAESLAAFRDGWTALRAGRNADAIVAFDRATDPTIAEDAVYWAAIASERAGDQVDALRRYRDLLARFPQSARATDARTAVDRLAP